MKTPLAHTIHNSLFQSSHQNFLIYNTYWEDPRIDRQLLQLDADSQVVMISSAGCNALDYLLDAPAAIHATDTNPRQNTSSGVDPLSQGRDRSMTRLPEGQQGCWPVQSPGHPANNGLDLPDTSA